jgi:hypothetical protein
MYLFQINNFLFLVSSFVKMIRSEKTALVHYSGSEDEKYHEEKVLNTSELEEWVEVAFKKKSLKTEIIVPYVSQHMDFL